MNQSDALKSEQLVEVLGRIPLAITQAAAFMVRNKFNAQRYLGALEKDERTRIDFLSTELQDPRRERGTLNSVFRTWRLSFEQIRTQVPRSAEILSLIAMLDGEMITEDLLQEQGEKEVDFATAIGTLIDYSLITKEAGEETCAMHPLVQLSVQYWPEQEERTAYFAGRSLQVLAKKFPNGEHENWRVCEVLLPHARAVLKHDVKAEHDVQNRAELSYNVGWFDWQQGRYELAGQNVWAAYNARQEALGDDDILTLHSRGMLGAVLGDQGKYEEAEATHRRALQGYEKVLMVEHPHTLTSVSNLGLVLGHQGKYEEAAAMHRRALQGYEKVLGIEHPNTLTSVYCLAYLFHVQQDFAQAEGLSRRALDGYGNASGTHHPTTATCQRHYTSMARQRNGGST